MKTDQLEASKEIEAFTVPYSPLDDESLDGTTPFGRTTSLETSKFYMGSIMTFLARGKDTGGRLALMEYQAKPGNEPPPHIHEWEHETYYIIEGVMEFYSDGKIVLAKPGDFVFLPQGKAHAFYIRSPKIRVLIGIQATGEESVGLESYFIEMSSRAESLELPEHAVTYVMDDPEHAVRIGAKHGITILTPDDTKKLIPYYPGFGVPRELYTE